jgi:hypothetical protein
VLRRIWGLRTVASISLRMWLPRKVMPADYTTVVMGTPQPAATIIDYTNRVTELQNGPWGSVIEFEGQEGLHRDLSDTDLVREMLATFVSLPFVDRAKVDVDAIVAQTGDHHHEFRRKPITQATFDGAGPLKYRPIKRSNRTRTHFAGDRCSSQPTASWAAAPVARRTCLRKVGLPDAIA